MDWNDPHTESAISRTEDSFEGGGSGISAPQNCTTMMQCNAIWEQCNVCLCMHDIYSRQRQVQETSAIVTESHDGSFLLLGCVPSGTEHQ